MSDSIEGFNSQFKDIKTARESLKTGDVIIKPERRFLRSPEKEDGSFFRLSKEPILYSDSQGIDLIELLPPQAKIDILGRLKRHELPAKINRFNETVPVPAEIEPEIFDPENDDQDEFITSESLKFEKGVVEVSFSPSAVEAQISNKKERVFARYKVFNDRSADNKLLLGVDIETASGSPVVQIPRGLNQNLLDRSWDVLPDSAPLRARYSFLRDPLGYIELFQNANFTPELMRKTENRLIKFWKESFGNLRDPAQKRFYPGQLAEKIPGFAVGVLDRVVKMARLHEYSGVAATPFNFHDAEFLEKQGFKFERPEDAERMAMIKTALRLVDQDRYDAAISEAFKSELDRDEAVKRAKLSRFTPQERSWIVVLNSLRNHKKIPKEFNLLEKIKVESERLEQRIDSTLYQLRRLDSDPHKAYYSDEIYYAEERLARLTEKQDKLKKWLTMFSFAGFHLPSEKNYTQSWDENRMLLRFKDESEIPERAQDELNSLIENDIVTGNTLYPAGGQLEKIMGSEEKHGQPFYIVYHMYDKNGFVKQPNGTRVERDNTGHFEEIKKEIGAVGLETSVEKARGNVRNPGPNQPYGWQSEEPSVWTDELTGIERSELFVFLIKCDSLEAVERATEVLHKVGYKEKENETGNDPRWFVPDIRIFGLSENDAKKLPHYKSALLHTKKGQKDGYASTITHETHRMVSGFKHVPVVIHEAMDGFIAEEEKRVGEYEFVSR